MGRSVQSDERTADSTCIYDRLELDPDYIAYKGGELSAVWAYSERLRRILDKAEQDPSAEDRWELASSVTRQLSTLALYRQAISLAKSGEQTLSLYTILFPGETEDGTGIKDINDNIGYNLNNKFITCRQKAIRDLFWQNEKDLPPKFVAVGQDYKSAQVLAIGKSREEFAVQLAELDKKLKVCLNAILDEAEQEERDKKEKGQPPDEDRLKAIGKTRKAILPEKYKFEFLFGVRVVDFRIKDPIEATFLMLTEALKAAGVARFIAKISKTTTRAGKAQNKGFKLDPPARDQRGKSFRWADFHRLAKRSGDLKDLIRKTPTYLNIFVDEVWALALYEYRRGLFVLNPDVVRDVRKRKLRPATRRQGLKSRRSFDAQKELLEMWLIAVNGLDYVKDFLSTEFRKEVSDYHDKSLSALNQLEPNPIVSKINYTRLIEVLTRDHLQKDSVSVLGNASEFMFYSYSSDHRSRIFFTFDIRDLGIQVSLLYDYFMGAIQVQQPKGSELMIETFASTDGVNARKRFTYNEVVKTFTHYFDKIKDPGARQQASQAFGGGEIERPGSFFASVQIMLGGDEIFVAAHPLFAAFVHDIVRDLKAVLYNERPLDLRTGVAFSKAEKGHPQKLKTWEAHDQAFGASSSAANVIKYWERMQRRIERLIDKLEANEKKARTAPAFRKKLSALGLTDLYARYRYSGPSTMDAEDYEALLIELDSYEGGVLAEHVELIDLSGNAIDEKALEGNMRALEKEVVEKVGGDNYYLDPPPLITKIPAWIEKVLDFFLPKERYPYEPKKPSR